MPWYTCDVEGAGPTEDGEVYVKLTDRGHQFNSRWFRAVESTRKETLAVALASISTALPVGAALQAIDQYSTIDRMYIKKS